MPESTPPVLVFGSGLTVLGVIRLLRAAGHRLYVVPNEHTLERPSRWFRPAPPSRGGAQPDDLPAYLHGLPFDRAVLLPCTDAWISRVARALPALSPQFVASVSSAEALEHIIDKWYLAELLDKLGLPHPRTMLVDNNTDLATIPSELLTDPFIKPRDSASFFRQFGVKAIRVKSREDVAAKLASLSATNLSVELQEYIPGPPDNHYYVEGFIDRHGNRTALFVRRRLRMYPPDFGNSTAFVSVRPDAVPDAVETVMRLLTHVGFRGIFSVELKRDERDGICRLLEVNARPWWYVEFAGQCGVNVIDMFVRDALGESLQPVADYNIGLNCVYPYYDFYACRSLHRDGKLSLSQWASSWFKATQPVMRWSDPVPALAASAQIARTRLKRLFSDGSPQR